MYRVQTQRSAEATIWLLCSRPLLLFTLYDMPHLLVGLISILEMINIIFSYMLMIAIADNKAGISMIPLMKKFM